MITNVAAFPSALTDREIREIERERIDAELHRLATQHTAWRDGTEQDGCPFERLRTIDALLDERHKLTKGT